MVVGLFLSVLISLRLGDYHGNPAGFLLFGHDFIRFSHPPAGAPILTASGYDGQGYWIQANDPLLLHDSTVANMIGALPGYHFQRVAYPALAFLLAAGQQGALPWALLTVNILAVLGITAAFSVYARSRGWSTWWALAIGLMPGLLMPALRDLTDTLAIATMVGGLVAWRSNRRWLAGGLLSLAVLSREPMTVAVVAVALDAAAQCWRARGERVSLRRIAAFAAPVVLLPAVAFVGWQLYLHVRLGSVPVAAGQPALAVSQPIGVAPFHDFVDEIRRALRADAPLVELWELVYIALVLAGMGVSLTLLRRRPTAAGISAVLLGAILTVVIFGDQWGVARYSAPMFGALLLVGLEWRSRAALTICAAAAAMSIFIPFVATGL
jgi:hypothetical protein